MLVLLHCLGQNYLSPLSFVSRNCFVFFSLDWLSRQGVLLRECSYSCSLYFYSHSFRLWRQLGGLCRLHTVKNEHMVWFHTEDIYWCLNLFLYSWQVHCVTSSFSAKNVYVKKKRLKLNIIKQCMWSAFVWFCFNLCWMSFFWSLHHTPIVNEMSGLCIFYGNFEDIHKPLIMAVETFVL